jgi:hypothetical protein
MKRTSTLAWVLLAPVALLAFAAGLFACAEKCQMNDPRTICNAYGAPDIGKDAGIVRPEDASVARPEDAAAE